jgi:2-methylcitrate dehydratase PrpD
MTTSHLTEGLCARTSSLRFAELPEIAVTRIAAAVADTVGCALAGIGLPAVAPVLGLALDEAGAGQASIFGRPERLPASAAALVNGTAAHALDFDDISSALYGHPSAVLVPALFASAERAGASGEDVVCAYAAGYEIAAVAGGRLNPDHYDKGWHATATIGALAAAGAVANLLKLSTVETQHAIGLAASQSAGLRRQFGTDAKPLHAGLAARAGVLSASLAARGMKADRAILDRIGDVDDSYPALYGAHASRADMSSELAIVARGLQVKRHACCAATHTSVDAVLRLFEENGLRPDMVESVDCRVNRVAADVLKYREPRTSSEAKFSLGFCVASAMMHGDCGIPRFSQSCVDDPVVKDLSARVFLTLDPAMPPLGTTPCMMTLRTRDGRTLVAEVAVPKGSPDDPLTREGLRRKFIGCATVQLSEQRAATLFDRLLNLPRLAHASDITTLAHEQQSTRRHGGDL